MPDDRKPMRPDDQADTGPDTDEARREARLRARTDGLLDDDFGTPRPGRPTGVAAAYRSDPDPSGTGEPPTSDLHRPTESTDRIAAADTAGAGTARGLTGSEETGGTDAATPRSSVLHMGEGDGPEAADASTPDERESPERARDLTRSGDGTGTGDD